MLYRVPITAEVIVEAGDVNEACARAEDRLWVDDDLIAIFADGRPRPVDEDGNDLEEEDK